MLLRKGFERSLYQNKYKIKSESKTTTNKFRYFLEVNRLFVLVYTHHANSCKTFKAPKYYLPKGMIKNYNAIINGKSFYDQPIDSDIKQYEKNQTINNRTRGNIISKSEAVDLSRQKELDASPKAIQKIKFVMYN